MKLEEELMQYILAKQRLMPKIISSKLSSNNKKLNHRTDYFRIKEYIDNFLNGNNQNRFIVMPGLRGVGKTTILLQLYEYLIKNDVPNSDILYFDVSELKSFYDVNILDVITNFIENIHQTTMVELNKPIFLLIDEVHFDKNWTLTGKIVYDNNNNIFMIFTGSSAIELQIHADAIRRMEKKPIFPCTFPEYLFLKQNIHFPKEMSFALQDLILNGNVDLAITNERKIQESMINLDNDPDIEFKKFLTQHSFPFSLKIQDFQIHEKTINNINRIIEKDIPSLKTFNTSTNDTISRIVTYIAMQKPGGTSNVKLAQMLGVSPNTINNILNVLEKTQLLFPITAYGTGSKIIKKPWEYFFLAPSIKTSINFEIGRYNLNNKKCLATLAETLVASSLYKLKLLRHNFIGLFYDPKKSGVDFLVRNIDKIIPIEVGVGKKTKSQLTKAINNYNSDYGILISNRTFSIKKENNIIYIPLRTFSYI